MSLAFKAVNEPFFFMQNQLNQPLTRATLMFPLALVLFEFSVYICNDLVQPAMLTITQDFGVGSEWVPASMSFFLLGGACLAWFLGPLSDRLGRRKVLLWGVLGFSLACFAILFTKSIEQFIAWRFIQGIGLTFIAAVGYAAIQENFAERDAIKVMAIMANISLIAPLIGPVLGAWMIEYVSWHWGFIGIGVLALFSWLGLYQSMPARAAVSANEPIANIWKDFKAVLSNGRFIALSLALPIVSIPLILWIALSPVMLVEEMGLSNMAYGWLQVPVLGGLILGNIVLIRIVDRLEVGKTVMFALPMMLVGSLVMLMGLFVENLLLPCLIVGMTLISFGEGMSFSVLYRFALMASNMSKGTVAAMVSIIMLLVFFICIELVRVLYALWSFDAYIWACVIILALWFVGPQQVVKNLMRERLNTP